MAVECPECKDVSKYATDAYTPYCRLANNEISSGAFESYCKRYPGYRDCPIYSKKYR